MVTGTGGEEAWTEVAGVEAERTGRVEEKPADLGIPFLSGAHADLPSTAAGGLTETQNLSGLAGPLNFHKHPEQGRHKRTVHQTGPTPSCQLRNSLCALCPSPCTFSLVISSSFLFREG